MKNTDYSKYLEMTPEELRTLQKTKGQPYSMFGSIVYFFLTLFGSKPKDFYGICPYFELNIGHGWGCEMGWFFLCSKGASDDLKTHEVGHLIQNGAVGGWKMVALCIGSMFRFWYRTIFNIIRPRYDDWWFEGQATKLGEEYCKPYIDRATQKSPVE